MIADGRLPAQLRTLDRPVSGLFSPLVKNYKKTGQYVSLRFSMSLRTSVQATSL